MMEILKGKLILLHEHPEGHNKIQGKYKSEDFVICGKYSEPDVYYIKPVQGKGQVQTIN